MKLSSAGFSPPPEEGEKQVLDSELWHACAGPLVSLPSVGSRVVYFPQGHSEHVAVSTNREVDGHMPNYPSLPPQLICQLHNVTMHLKERAEKLEHWRMQTKKHGEKKTEKKELLRKQSSIWIDEADLEKKILDAAAAQH